MKKIYYHKLIRDAVAETMRLGKQFETKTLNRRAFERALIAKIEEEAGGVVRARTRRELLDELADVLAVIDEIKKLKKISPVELRHARRVNIRKKGGFAKRLWLVWSQDDGYKTNEQRYGTK